MRRLGAATRPGRPGASRSRLGGATRPGMAGVSRLIPVLAALFALLAWLAPVVPARAETPAGPPFPAPVADQAVYDTAGLFDAPTIANAEATIDAIEERTRGRGRRLHPGQARRDDRSRPRRTRST